MSLPLPSLSASATHRAKVLCADTALMALGVAFEILSVHGEEMKREIADWPEGRTFALGVLPDGPCVAVRKGQGRLALLGRGDRRAPLQILFKNVDVALRVLTGQLSAHQAFAEHRMIVHGALDETVQASRAMAIVVKYLFPGPMLPPLFKRSPSFSRPELVLKARLLLTIGPALAKRLAH